MDKIQNLLDQYLGMIDSMEIYIATVLDHLEQSLTTKAIAVYQEYESKIQSFYELASYFITQVETNEISIAAERWETIQKKTLRLHEHMKILEQKLQHQLNGIKKVENTLVDSTKQMPSTFDQHV
jgi:hypothetical protein